MLDDLRFRNPLLTECLRSAKVVYRFSGSERGHVRLWLTSREARERVLGRGLVYLASQVCRAEEPDLHREIRRCYKCQQYGGIQSARAD